MNENGYMSLEATIILPLSIVFIIFLMYLSFLKVNDDIAAIDAGKVCILGSYTDDNWKEMFIATDSIDIQEKETMTRKTVSISGEISYPFAALWNIDSRWKFGTTINVPRMDRVQIKRLMRLGKEFIGGEE